MTLRSASSVDPLHLNFGAWSALREFRPDVVLSGGFTPAHMVALAYCRAHRRRYVCWGELFLRHGSESLALRRWVRRLAVGASDGWIASSRDSRDAFVHYGAQADRVLVSLMPVRNALFRRLAEEVRASGATSALRKQLGSPLICGVGRLIAQKGWRELLCAMREVQRAVPGCALAIAGDGPERARFEGLAASQGLTNVHFLGSRDLASLASLYTAADVFAFPTLCDPFGAVLVEAIACGTVAVSSEHAAATRDFVVDGNTGFTVDPSDVTSLAEALIRALRLSPQARADMARLAASRLPNDDIATGAAEIVDYCRTVASRDRLMQSRRASQTS